MADASHTEESLPVLYRDDHLIAVHKPSGLLVHRSGIDRHETRFALQEVRDHIGRRVYPVHRLDKPTSGVLLFALDPDTARLLTAQFTANAVHKTYLAVVRGYTPDADRIDYPLKEQLDRMTDSRARDDKPAQPAVTEYRCLERVELPCPVGRYSTARYSLLEVRPRTGRKHQIRRHMKHVFHPVIGDTTHGDGRHNRFFREQFGCQRLLLCATSLRLQHPRLDRPLEIQTRPDADFRDLLGVLGWAQQTSGPLGDDAGKH